jgi:hypothetical protein
MAWGIGRGVETKIKKSENEQKMLKVEGNQCFKILDTWDPNKLMCNLYCPQS